MLELGGGGQSEAEQSRGKGKGKVEEGRRGEERDMWGMLERRWDGMGCWGWLESRRVARWEVCVERYLRMRG